MTPKDKVWLLDWWAQACVRYCVPESLLFAIQIGGSASAKLGRGLKACGVRAGVPAFCLAVPMGEAHALFLYSQSQEKRNYNTAQRDFMRSLIKRNYAIASCYTWLNAREAIESYLGGSDNATDS